MSNHRAAVRRAAPVVAALGVAMLVLAGCSTSSAAPSATGDSATSQGLAPKAPKLSPTADKGASGEVVFCGGKDSGTMSGLAQRFNEEQSAVTARYVELGPDSDSARTAAVQRLEGGSADCDIYLTDVVWTAEWASQGWIYDQTDFVKAVGAHVMPSVLATTQYDGRNWATPFYTNAGLIFYRDDKVKAPKTWKDLYTQAAASADNRLLVQGKQYEGLTVNFLELLYSAGGDVIDDKGKVVIDSKETRTALTFLRDGLKNGSIDPASLTYDETATRRAFESGADAYQRNWPNAYKSALATPVGPTTAYAPLPAFDSSHKASGVLGGWNFAVAQKAKNVAGAAAFIKYAISDESQKKMILGTGAAPVVASVYSDPEVTAEIPFAAELKTAVTNAKPRPKSPVYAQISRAIYENVYAVLNNGADVDKTVKKMADEITKAQETF